MKLIAHRGLHSKNSKANTLIAIELASNHADIDGVEFDVRLTKDHHVVVIHDEFIDRTSNGSGKVGAMTLQRLKRFNYGTKIKPTSISTLEEVLDKMHSGIRIMIDVKNERENNHILASRILNILEKYPHLDVWLMSFQPEIVLYLKKYSTYKVGMLIHDKNQELLDIDADFYAISKDIINKEIVHSKLQDSKDILIWTITDQQDIDMLKKRLNNTFVAVDIIGENLLMLKL